MENRKHSTVFLIHSFFKVSFLVLLYPSNQCFIAGAIPTPISTSSALQLHQTFDELNLSNRMSEIEARSRHQENEITTLKTLRVEDKKIINQLRDRVEQLESTAAERIFERQKRPFRLAPINFQRGKDSGKENDLIGNEKENIDQKFYGPATSCDELGMLGYTLNGFYIVKARAQTTGSSYKFEIVYCRFYQPLDQRHWGTRKEVLEDRFGYLNAVKSGGSGIYFYVARHGDLPTYPNGVIRFNKELLNMGGAMNISTGVFTAPKAGIYHFSFSLGKEGYSNIMDIFWIYFRLNGNKIGTSFVSTGIMTVPATAPFVLKLKKGDRVDLWKPNGGAVGKCIGTTEPCNHFTGWLLEDIFY